LTKKEREAKKKEDGTPASENPNDENGGPPSPSQDDNAANSAPQKLEKGEKKASKIDEKLKKGEYVPWHTCPSCKRSLLITRFAKHLEQCMGLSGRAASRNAMAKMNGSGNGTPGGSRGGTPGPSSQENGGKESKDADEKDELDDENDKSQGVRKKLLKKGLKDKVKKENASGKTSSSATNGKLPKSLTKSGSKSDLRSSPAPSGGDRDSKRDRSELGEDDDDEASLAHVKKRQKLQRVGSTASVISQSTVGGGGADMERSESLDGDGSFVDD
jgi:hypothetical protein